MTYCVGLRVASGIVMLSDTRTNAGLDNISRFSKMFTFEQKGERVIAMMTSGNLSITQGVMSRLRRNIQKAEEEGCDVETVLNAPTLFRVAQIVGDEMRGMQGEYRDAITAQGVSTDASILLAGQRKGGKLRLYLVYSAGNFIEATRDTPFFQIGEHKYGKPILDRVISFESSIEDVVKGACVSMESTMRSNLSVGMPLDLVVIENGALSFSNQRRIEANDEGFASIARNWSQLLRNGFEKLPALAD